MTEKYSVSFLDRLVDAGGPGPGAVDRQSRHVTLAEIKSRVARDLEALLNTRHLQDAARFAGYPEVQASIMTFGIDDFSDRSLANPEHRQQICRSIEQAVRTHEPRLRDVEVSLSLETSDARRLSFVIRAVLLVDRRHEQVSFDALLQPLTLQYSVRQGGALAREAGG